MANGAISCCLPSLIIMLFIFDEEFYRRLDWIYSTRCVLLLLGDFCGAYARARNQMGEKNEIIKPVCLNS